MAFDRLILPDGRYWVERQTLHRLQAGRDLVTNAADVGCGERLARTASRDSDASGASNADECGSSGPMMRFAQSAHQHPTGHPTLVAFGGIDYGKFPAAEDGNRGAAMNRRLRAEHGKFSVLPHTGREVSAILREYRANTGQPAKAWYGKEAGEGRLKSLLSPTARPPRVLHLATHGFFLSNKGGEGAPRPDRPMALGGLALAGANRGMGGKTGPDGEDGVLYALEAQSLNLQGTELVVLSACDTGKGEIDYSDGVYGLTRAFRIAGAGNVLMTLWPLDDALAREFMADFYCNWLGGERRKRCQGVPLPPAEALRQTRLAWIKSDDERRRDPKYWAPYVLVE
uniref:CHAT domain-containing protein n=1 Tax=Candidatus Kentrum sp. FM TaxID=2126340 RepID=A0A450W7J9_9GAMM|nr:MAG: CHAT domain-containing protein [Candidatus Kentron sp. FM]VFJ60569.1 MAG: CHAT domain-containing protein [Candidatus Kentron sp. FM]VFK12989.1 MAG: CHAT domain-containing protein [Candidatus Kentron sp. FM]